MLRFSKLKILAVVAVALAAILFTLPSFTPEPQRKAFEASIPAWLPKWLVPHRAIPLGLDLQGGAHVLLEVDANAVQRGLVNGLRDDVRRVLREERVSLQGGIAVQPRGVQVRITDANERARVLPKLRALSQPIGNQLAGTVSGNTANVVEGENGLVQIVLTDAGLNDKVRRAVDQSIEVLRRRIDPEGVKEPNIQRQGLDRVLVQVPGLQDTRELEDILGRTAKLQFRFVAEGGANPADTEQLRSQEDGQLLTVERTAIVEGEDLTDAQPGFDSRTNEPIVNFRFNIRGAQRFGEATTKGVGRLLAIVLDNEVISAPRIQTAITGGSGQISGRFTVEAANKLSVLLRAGALPAPLTIVERRTVGPGLGADSIQAGKIASYVAGALVAGFMFLSYGLFGLFANIALAIHIMMVFAIMSLIGATLTLPGIAGIVLTIGTAVDANVLIYERIREEARAGRPIVSSLEAGFNRAFATIMDSNVTMFIAAAILYFLGSGPVRGFAVTLIIGIVTTVITAVTMTRMMIALWYRTARPQRIPF